MPFMFSAWRYKVSYVVRAVMVSVASLSAAEGIRTLQQKEQMQVGEGGVVGGEV